MSDLPLLIDVEAACNAIIEELNMARSELDEGEVLIVETIGSDDVFTVERIGYRQPNLIRLSGKDSSGNDASILCHVSQIKLSVRFEKSEQPRPKIGFGAWRENQQG
jgi:hypothetical protein